ncbi:MAG: asparagine synthetase B family protein [Kiloniellaceae bacterium]
MAAALSATSAAQSANMLRPGAGMALRGDPAESDWREEVGLCAVVVGYPRWADAELARLAAEQGHAAALLEAYRRHGCDLLDRLFGHFSFAILEPARGRAFCAIDRFGIYRLCLATPRAGHFVFSTSVDSLRAYPGTSATISPQTLYQYLFFIDRVAAPGTIYEGQSKLCPGEALLFSEGSLRRWRYSQLDYRRTSEASKAEQHEALRERLEHAVARCLEGENADKTTSFLSGGLDSSAVAGFLAKANAGKGRCVTIAFQHAEFDETEYAEIAARHFGLKHEIFMVGPQEVLAVLPKLSAAFDEPYSNSSVVPCYYCARVSKEAGDDVMLAGDGGDELFGGNTRYLKDGIFDHYRMLPGMVRNLLEPVLAHTPWRHRIPLLRQASNYVELARRSVAHRMTSHNAFAFTPVSQVFSAEALAAIDPEGPRRFAEAIYDAASGDAKIQKMMHLDLQLTLADSDLRKVLTSCTTAGIRVRFPMLDDDLADFSATLPASALTEDGKIRQFYKDALAGFLPRAILDKPKMGFGLPMFQYIAEMPALADFFCDALTDLKCRAFFDSHFLDHMVDEVRQGRPGTHAGIVWDLAVLETWMASRTIPANGSTLDVLRPPDHAAAERVHQG